MSLVKRILITLAILVAPFVVGLIITYQVIPVNWISFMEIQPSYRPMEAPLPVPARSVPVQGAAYLPGVGAPQNPVPADEASLARGKYLFEINCAICHGLQGKGDGSVAASLRRKPADLTGENARLEDDGTLFLVITNGFAGIMPPLKENLLVGDRWDVVNYVRSLQQ